MSRPEDDFEWPSLDEGAGPARPLGDVAERAMIARAMQEGPTARHQLRGRVWAAGAIASFATSAAAAVYHAGRELGLGWPVDVGFGGVDGAPMVREPRAVYAPGPSSVPEAGSPEEPEADMEASPLGTPVDLLADARRLEEAWPEARDLDLRAMEAVHQSVAERPPASPLASAARRRLEREP